MSPSESLEPVNTLIYRDFAGAVKLRVLKGGAWHGSAGWLQGPRRSRSKGGRRQCQRQ